MSSTNAVLAAVPIFSSIFLSAATNKNSSPTACTANHTQNSKGLSTGRYPEEKIAEIGPCNPTKLTNSTATAVDVAKDRNNTSRNA